MSWNHAIVRIVPGQRLRRLAPALASLISCLIFASAAQAQPWWDVNWNERKKLTFDNAAQATPLVDFPVLVLINTERIYYTKTQNNGEDIRFIDADGTTQLNYEIEKWDETGNSYVWVKVPQIDASSTTDHIWMYYDNPSASDNQNAEVVWSNAYQGVWHLKEDPSGTAPQMLESTGNANPGDRYIADTKNNRIRKIDATTGNITTIAGTGSAGYSGDGGPATSAQISPETGGSLAVDSSRNLYLDDTKNYRIRKIDAATGNITTIAGTGSAGYSGDGGPATSAQIHTLGGGLAVDSAGNLYIADTKNHRIRKIDAATGNITTIAGTGSAGYSGDGGPATSAQIKTDIGGELAVDSSGNLYLEDMSNYRIRKIDAATGNITTIAGTGSAGYSGDGGPATSAQINTFGSGLAVDSAGNVYIVDAKNARIRKVDAGTGNITTIAGTGSAGYSGDGGPATSAQIFPETGGSLAIDISGNLYLEDTKNNRIRKIDASTGDITTIAGTGSAGYSGDGGPATSAQINTLGGGVPVDTARIHGTANGSMSFVDQVAGQIDGSLNFDGVDDRVEVASSNSLDILTKGTIEFWMYPKEDAGAGPTYSHVLGRWGGNSGGHWVFFALQPASSYHFEVSDGSTKDFISLNNSLLKLNWYHVVLTWDVDATNDMKAYVNGVLDKEGNSGFTAMGDAVRSLQIASSSDDFYGNLDEVRIANVARSADWNAAQYKSMTDTFIKWVRKIISWREVAP